MFTEHKTVVAALLMALFLSNSSVHSQGLVGTEMMFLCEYNTVHFQIVKENLPNYIGASSIGNRFVHSKDGCRKRS